jgi:hypothetical protein
LVSSSTSTAWRTSWSNAILASMVYAHITGKYCNKHVVRNYIEIMRVDTPHLRSLALWEFRRECGGHLWGTGDERRRKCRCRPRRRLDMVGDSLNSSLRSRKMPRDAYQARSERTCRSSRRWEPHSRLFRGRTDSAVLAQRGRHCRTPTSPIPAMIRGA